jgi:hypothetical protein
MGEAKRRKKLDPTYGKTASDHYVVEKVVNFINQSIVNGLKTKRDSVFIMLGEECKISNSAKEKIYQIINEKTYPIKLHLYIETSPFNDTVSKFRTMSINSLSIGE